MPPTFTTLTNVSAGTGLTNTLYNNTIGANGSLKYLYYALNPFFGTCADYNTKIPVDVEWSISGPQGVPNATWYQMNWDALTYGSAFYNAQIFDPAYAGCTGNINADINLLVCVRMYWSLGGGGMRGIRFRFVTNTNCTPILNTSATETQRTIFNNQAQNVGTSFTFIVPMLVTSSNPSFTCAIDAYQSTGAAKDLNEATVRIFKLPAN